MSYLIDKVKIKEVEEIYEFLDDILETSNTTSLPIKTRRKVIALNIEQIKERLRCLENLLIKLNERR